MLGVLRRSWAGMLRSSTVPPLLYSSACSGPAWAGYMLDERETERR